MLDPKVPIYELEVSTKREGNDVMTTRNFMDDLCIGIGSFMYQ